jgi:hypothetical protein
LTSATARKMALSVPWAQGVMVGNRQPVVARGIRFQNHMAALLIDPVVTVMFAEQLD